jgi:hypothetical protein
LPTPRLPDAAIAASWPRNRIHGLASGAADLRNAAPATSPAERAAVLLNYVLRPAGFIGHCNVRSSLNVAGEFRTSKKRCLRFGYGRRRQLSQRLSAAAFGDVAERPELLADGKRPELIKAVEAIYRSLVPF